MNVNTLLSNSKNQLILLILLAVGLNINTLFNQYAVDDAIVLTNNTFVQKGIKGIPEIMTQEYFKGLGTLKGNELSGGRYRPFALIIFALEVQFFGTNPFISHLINVLLFVLLIVLLYKVLNNYIFREQNKYLAFITCILFAAHPIHTEVIANVKSRDEILAFILILIALISLIKKSENKSMKNLIIGLLCFLLALLTKESSVSFILVFPLVLYFFFHKTIKQSILLSFPLFIVLVGYMALRYSVIGFNVSTSNLILNSPYLFATSSQAFATKVSILIKYIELLIIPHPLSSDYSYKQIPYINIVSVEFIISLSIVIGLIVSAFYTLSKKTLYSFCIFFFLINILLVSNFIINIGAPMAERLLFQPSLSYCILLALVFVKFNYSYKRISNSLLVLTLLLFSIKTIARNAEWKNNDTLYFADVITSPNSLRTNTYTAESYLNKANKETNSDIKKAYLQKSVYYGERAIKIDSNEAAIYLHLGSAYFGLFNYFKAADLWLIANKLDPLEPETKKATVFISTFLFKEGISLYDKEKIEDAINCYKKATELNDESYEAWYNLGGCYFRKKDTLNANLVWNRVKLLKPEFEINKEEFISN